MSGTSYQDIDSRLKTVEQMLMFVMTAIRMNGVVATGLLGPDGKPTGKTINGTLLDFYRMAQVENLKTVSVPQTEPQV